MIKNYKYAIFDLDGTLLDTAEDLADSVNFALAKASLETRSLEDVKRFVGNGVANLIRRSLPENTSEEIFRGVFEDFKQHYEGNMSNKTLPFDGIAELLKELCERGVGISVASNKYQQGVEYLCELFFHGLYSAALGEREGITRKPDPSIVLTAISEMGGKKEQTVYIGDSEVDGQTAKNAGVDFIGVSWGLRAVELLYESGALTVVDSPEQLLEYFI